MIIAEGVYSMDGDVCDLPGLIEIKKKHKAILFIDEVWIYSIFINILFDIKLIILILNFFIHIYSYLFKFFYSSIIKGAFNWSNGRSRTRSRWILQDQYKRCWSLDGNTFQVFCIVRWIYCRFVRNLLINKW